MHEPTPDSLATADLLVKPTDLASALPIHPQDAFPAVFATSRLVALMEIASARLLQPHLSPGELSVGVSVEVTHSAPTPLGARVTAQARYLGREGKLFLFEIVASDAGGEVGRARHKRAIVNVERLQNTAMRRAQAGPAMESHRPEPASSAAN
ncbi:MAG: hotdog domain-containing protein [Verrucomicrobiota bacterium]